MVHCPLRPLGSLAIILAILAAPVPRPIAAADAPPWGLDTVTTADTGPEQIRQALPTEFGSYQLNTQEVTGFTHALPQAWAADSTNYGYYDPTQASPIPPLIVNVSTLKAGVPVESVITALRAEAQHAPARVRVEQADTGADVPYLAAVETTGLGIERSVLTWGNVHGRWLFRVEAAGAAERELFVKTLVTRLRMHAAPATESPTAASPIAGTTTTQVPRSPTPRPISTLRPTATQSPTTAPVPTNTVTPRPTPPAPPTGTPDEATDFAQADAQAVACLKRNDLGCSVNVLEAAYRRHPASVRIRDDLYLAYWGYGFSWEEQQSLDRARANYRKAIDLDPGRPEARAALDRLAPYARILDADGFHSGDRSFPTGSEDTADYYYANDTLVIHAKGPNGGGGYQLSRAERRDGIAIGISFAVQSGYEGEVYLSFGKQADGSAYYFDVAPGRWRLRHYAPATDSNDVLIPWTPVARNGGGVWNRMEVRLTGSDFHLILNDQEVGSSSDASYVVGKVGFGLPTMR